jgi:hypothetical protein
MPPPVIDAKTVSQMAIDAYRIPSVTGYNRLEASPRTEDVQRSLKAEVRDALWMLTRQWQFGESKGEDSASPITSAIVGEHTVIEQVAFPDNHRFAFDDSIPLETQVERERVPRSLFLATEMGRYFLRLMRDNGLDAAHRDRFIAKYPLQYVVERNDLDGQQLFAAVGAELFDGTTLHEDIVTVVGGVSRFQSWMDAEAISGADQTTFRTIAQQYQAWSGRTYSQPGEIGSAWLPSQLEYQFEVSAPAAEKRMVAAQYSEGHLDWYSFDFDGAPQAQGDRPASGGPPSTASPSRQTATFIPAPVAFKGMPNPRFWTMEEGLTDFGALDTSTTGLLHLLFAEFGLIYGNDWFLLPYPMNINVLCEILGLTVTDVFGQHTLIRPAGRGPDSNWQRWVMFHHTDVNTRSASSQFYLTPSIAKAVEGEPLERVAFLRDEMANLVWAVENTVPSQVGKGVNGNEMALKDTPPPPFVPFNDTAQIRYVAGTTVPDNWIPFIPVHMEDSDREIRLQRARMAAARGPLGVLLNEKAAPYYVNEEEVPRAGISVERSFQRARWFDGKTLLWIGRYKGAGKGEGWSNLKFDQIVDIPQNFR